MKTKEKILYCIWLGLFILCGGLGTITERNAFGSVILTILSLIFFIPAIILLYDGITRQNRNMLLRVRIIAISSLFLTLALIIINTLAIFSSEAVGQFLNDLLIIVSAPMFCCYWQGVSLFLWACVFVSSFPRMWKK